MKYVILGRPEPQGSTSSFIRNGKIATTSANKKLKPWRKTLSDAVFVESGCVPYLGAGLEPVTVTVDFFFQKPLRAPKRRRHHTVKPDVDKLLRAVLDALTGIVYRDDAQVVDARGRKHYGMPERCEIEVIAG